MKTLANIWNSIKKYPYKMWTVVILLVVASSANYFLQYDWVSYIELILFSGLGLFTIAAFFAGVRNTFFKDGNKLEAIVWLIVGIAFVASIIYLVFIRQPEL